MSEYIEREALIAEYDRVHIGAAGGARKLMAEAPAVDVVSQAVFDQVKWERDTALATLKEHGIGLAEKTDVVEVVRGHWKGIELKDTCSVCNRSISEICDADSDIEIEVLSELIACPFCGARMQNVGSNHANKFIDWMLNRYE